MPRDANGVYHEPTNDDRRGWATAALAAYAKITDGKSLQEACDEPSEPFRPVLEDLLADLMHLVGRARWEGAMDRAYVNYYAEETP